MYNITFLKIKPLKGVKVIKVNNSLNTMFNMDFDGDEINIFIPINI